MTIAYAASGQSPFGTGTSEVILYRILHETPDIAAVPAALRAQVAAAMDKDPHARPAAPELLSQLTRTAAVPSAGSDNPTQTVLAQTWHPAAPSAVAAVAPAPAAGGLVVEYPVVGCDPATGYEATGYAAARCAAAGGHAPPGPAHPGPDGRHPARRRRRGPRLRPVRELLDQPNTTSGGASHSPTAPAASAVTNSSAGASSPSNSSSSSSTSGSTTGTTSPSQPAASASAPG